MCIQLVSELISGLELLRNATPFAIPKGTLLQLSFFLCCSVLNTHKGLDTATSRDSTETKFVRNIPRLRLYTYIYAGWANKGKKLIRYFNTWTENMLTNVRAWGNVQHLDSYLRLSVSLQNPSCPLRNAHSSRSFDCWVMTRELVGSEHSSYFCRLAMNAVLILSSKATTVGQYCTSTRHFRTDWKCWTNKSLNTSQQTHKRSYCMAEGNCS
jgi:hypothetical protein